MNLVDIEKLLSCFWALILKTYPINVFSGFVFNCTTLEVDILFCFILQGIDDKVLVEIFLEGGCEFTAIVLDVGSTTNCQPVVLLPTEVCIFPVGF